jgi:exonuclease VII small subunit
MSKASDVTFEKGYRRLQDISERVNSEEVPVHEMCDLFAEGKGLALALGGYLDEQKARVEAIERGEGIKAFRVVPPGDEKPASERNLDSAGAATDELPF